MARYSVRRASATALTYGRAVAVVAVLHRRHDDPRRRRRHERLGERGAVDERALGVELGGVEVRHGADGRRGVEEVDLHPLAAAAGQFEVVGVLEQVAHHRPPAAGRRSRSCGAGRR